MADIRNINMDKGEILVNLSVSRAEYDSLKQNTDNLLLVPTNAKDMKHLLTTGTLGNSNRIMLPKKVMVKERISGLDKKVPAQILKSNGDVFLMIKLRKSELGIPKFKE